jgi:hypothetical protein
MVRTVMATVLCGCHVFVDDDTTIGLIAWPKSRELSDVSSPWPRNVFSCRPYLRTCGSDLARTSVKSVVLHIGFADYRRGVTCWGQA